MTPVIPMFRSEQSTAEHSASTINFGNGNMIDWVEGYLEMQRMMKAMHEAMLKKNSREAHELCIQIAAEARITAHQIALASDHKPQ